MYKVIQSAASNAKNAGEDKNLYIKEIKVGAGPKLKRVRFTSRSRISHYIKFRSYIQVVLDVQQVQEKAPTKAHEAKTSKVKTSVKKAPVKKPEAKKPEVKKQ
ncbi:uL22 family ribosomal protein [Patescibacteria group bacterium]|nr:uL22 family ribosomal protein [Patescibacteria group bacterium]